MMEVLCQRHTKERAITTDESPTEPHFSVQQAHKNVSNNFASNLCIIMSIQTSTTTTTTTTTGIARNSLKC